MESEKVKEIKYRLKKEYFKLDKEYSEHLASGGKADEREEKIYFLKDVIECIYELESENERIKRSKNIQVYRLEHRIDRLEHQIAEMTEENEVLRKHNIGYHVANNHEAKEQLKQFAERLKEKLFDLGNIVNENDIDETLKEFINE